MGFFNCIEFFKSVGFRHFTAKFERFFYQFIFVRVFSVIRFRHLFDKDFGYFDSN